MTSENTAGQADTQLGVVQQTLFIPLAARARETRRKRPVLHDPRAAELIASIDVDAAKYERGFGGWMMVLRTAIYDFWVRQFLAEHPAGTVVELGTGLNTRFDRVDNGQVHWIDLDLPDVIALRGRFFTDTSRRRMVPASVLSDEWLPVVADSPGPYFFVTEGVLAYLPEQDVTATLARLATRFRGARLALDTYPQRLLQQQHKLAAAAGHRAAGSGRATTPGRCSGSACGWTSRPRSPGRPGTCAASCRRATGTCCCRWPTRCWAGCSPRSACSPPPARPDRHSKVSCSAAGAGGGAGAAGPRQRRMGGGLPRPTW